MWSMSKNHGFLWNMPQRRQCQPIERSGSEQDLLRASTRWMVACLTFLIPVWDDMSWAFSCWSLGPDGVGEDDFDQGTKGFLE